MTTKATKKLKLASLPVQFDPGGPVAGNGRPDVQRGGPEPHVPSSPARTPPLEQLRGSVLRYDNPTDPVWPVDLEHD
ncbi:hypothetical protein HDG35_003213 [Paraburkholderia sp. JPY681]|nr:hypothetical protein [Paraburkholderia atlantica]